METNPEYPEYCNHKENRPIDVFLAIFIAVGILASYLPQHYKIISTKTSEGISPWFLLLGAISMTCSFFNVLILQFVQFGCCKDVYSTGYCFENLLAIIQLSIQWTCFTVIVILFIKYFPEYKKYISNVDLGIEEYSMEWKVSIQVAVSVAFHFFFTFLVSVYLLMFVGLVEKNMATRYWADLLGIVSSILASIQYLPQIWETWKRKSVGAISIPMMLIQTPGSFLFAYSLSQSAGTRWTTWFVFIITGCLQGTLLIMCICWHFREKRASTAPDLTPDERTRLLHSQNN